MANSKKVVNNTQPQQPMYQGQPQYSPQYQQPMYQQPMYPPQKKKGKALGIISLILGIIAILLSIIVGFINIGNVGIAVIVAIPCIIIAIIGIAKNSGRGMSITGLILSILAIATALFLSLMFA